MKISIVVPTLVALAVTAGCGGAPEAPPPAPAPAPAAPAPDPADTAAKDALRAACARIAAAKTLTIASSESHDRIASDGTRKTIQFQREMIVRRPDGLWLHVSNADKDASAFYDGATLTVFQPKLSFYAQAKAPATLDETMDLVAQRAQLNLPLADLFYSDPYAAYVGPDTKGRVVGSEDVGGVKAQHLAFTDPALDVDVWLEEGGSGLPKKLVLTYTGHEAKPQSTIVFDSWTLDAPVEASRFTFTPPEGAVRIPFAGQDMAAADGT